VAREKRKGDEEAGAPAWMTTFADLMSLLLCFFVLLLSFSTISEEEFNQAMMSLQGAFGVLPRNSDIFNLMPKPPRPTQRTIEEVARRLRRKLQIRDKQNDVKVEYTEQGGLKVVLANQILFDTASADLKPDALPVLDDVAEVLAGLEGAFFEVRGHTDSRPLRGSARFRDNHDLSWARADAVARFLSGPGKLDFSKVEITGCGAGQPVAPNDTPEGMQANRRVEVHVRGVQDEDRWMQLQQDIQNLPTNQTSVPDVGRVENTADGR